MTYLGLRPGEKLYEELLVKTEELDKTDNSMIFIERDTALNKEEIYKKIKALRDEVYLSCLDFAKNNLKFYNPHRNFIIFVKRARIESPYRSATQTLTLFTLAKSNAAQTKGQFFYISRLLFRLRCY